MFKDPYLFGFLGATAAARGTGEIEQALVDHVQHFLLELGAGFAFVGRQVLLEVGDQDFFADSALLPPEAPPLHRRRTQGRAVQTRPSSGR